MKLVLTPKQTKAFKKDIIWAIKRCKTSSQLNMVINLFYSSGEASKSEPSKSKKGWVRSYGYSDNHGGTNGD